MAITLRPVLLALILSISQVSWGFGDYSLEKLLTPEMAKYHIETKSEQNESKTYLFPEAWTKRKSILPAKGWEIVEAFEKGVKQGSPYSDLMAVFAGVILGERNQLSLAILSW